MVAQVLLTAGSNREPPSASQPEDGTVAIAAEPRSSQTAGGFGCGTGTASAASDGVRMATLIDWAIPRSVCPAMIAARRSGPSANAAANLARCARNRLRGSPRDFPPNVPIDLWQMDYCLQKILSRWVSSLRKTG